jgi:hypothetical protein
LKKKVRATRNPKIKSRSKYDPVIAREIKLIHVKPEPRLKTKVTLIMPDNEKPKHNPFNKAIIYFNRMNNTRFWEIIDRARFLSRGEQDEMLLSVRKQLSGLTPDEIKEWQEIFDKYNSNAYKDELWKQAGKIMYLSDDGFEYFRCWLISKGQEAYSIVLNNPESLIELTIEDAHMGFELLLYVASEAYEEVTGKDDFYDKTSDL